MPESERLELNGETWALGPEAWVLLGNVAEIQSLCAQVVQFKLDRFLCS